MDFFDKFQKRMFKNGTTIQEQVTNEMMNEFTEYLYDSPNYYEIKINNSIETYDSTLQDVSFNDKRNADEKLLCVFNENPIKVGDNVFCDNKDWLTIFEEDNTIKSHRSLVIRPCNNILKFYNPFSKLIQIPCIAENNLGLVDENSTMSTGDAKLTITMSNNNLTQDIKRNKRLICDGTAWHVTNISKLKTGLIELTCKEEEPQNGDDLINEIPKNEYLSINILLDSNYSINLGSTLKLNPIVIQGDSIIDLPLIFTSDNTDIVTVDNLGNITTIGVGTANITCSLENNEDIKFITNIEVVNEVIVDNFTYDITSSNGLSIIKKTTTVSYTAHKYNNLVEVPNTLFDFEIIYGTLSTSAITVIETTDTYIKIKGLIDSGNFVLRVTERNTSNYIEKTIQLKNIYGN